MSSSRFIIGQRVMFKPRMTGPVVKPELCEIVRELPSETRDHHYRVKVVATGVERAVFESELQDDPS